MKVKNAELLGLMDDLTHLLAEKIKLKVKGDVYLLIERLKPLVDSYNKVRNEFIKKYGRGSEGKGYSITPEEWEKMGKEIKDEWEELNNQEQEVKSRLTFTDLENVESSHPYKFLFKILKQ